MPYKDGGKTTENSAGEAFAHTHFIPKKFMYNPHIFHETFSLKSGAQLIYHSGPKLGHQDEITVLGSDKICISNTDSMGDKLRPMAFEYTMCQIVCLSVK